MNIMLRNAEEQGFAPTTGNVTSARSLCLDSWCAHLHVRVQGLCGSCATSHVTNLLQDCVTGPLITKKCPHGKQAYYCQVFQCPFVAVVRVQMALTPMRKEEGIPIVSEKLFFSLDTSCPHKHDTCATSSCTPLILLPHPTGILCDPRV